MVSAIRNMCSKLFDIEPEDRQKLMFLSIIFFFVIGGYTLARELKNSIFMGIVGKEYQPIARSLAMFVLMPALFLYSMMVDRMRRYQLVAVYSAFFGIAGLFFAYFIGHPTIGIANTDTSPYRIFGWLFYFFVEGYSPFVVSVFWAFANSVNSPESAKKSYGFMVAASKIGGMTSALFGWLFFSAMAQSSSALFSNAASHQIALTITSCMLLLIPAIIAIMMRTVPGKNLHGYEAAYKVEKQKKREGKNKTGVFTGLTMMMQYPYVMGIFGMVFFYEVTSTVLGYMRLGVAQQGAMNAAHVTAFLFETALMTHVIGFFISSIGTRALLKRLGERICLLLIPTIIGILLLYLTVASTPLAFKVVFAAFQAVNYAFTWPVRESLYIPTVKEIKFKSKSWIDTFGSKFGRTSGSTFNLYAAACKGSVLMSLHSFFFAGVIGLWFMTAFLLGKRFDKAIANNEVIGA